MRRLPLAALAMGAFGIGVTEFAPMGLLRLIAIDLNVSIPTAGLLVTAYALGVMIGAPLVTLATVRVPRKALLIALMGVFTVGNLLAAISSDYGMLLVARLVTSLCHGAFFGVGSVVAADLVPGRDRAGAIAFMFMGLTIANVGGVPLAAWAGETIGWRSAFWGIAGVGIVAMTALAWALPATRASGTINVRAELLVLRRPAVLAALSLTVLGAGAMFTVFTYIAPIVRDEMHGTANLLTAMLVLYGIGLTIGNWLGGRYADRSVDVTLLTVLSALTVLLLIFAGVMDWAIPAALSVLAWGIATFALVPPLQLRVLMAAGDAPSLASAMNIGAFNLGNALGAAFGGAVIALKLGYHAIPVAGALVAAAGLLLTFLTRTPMPRSATQEQKT